MLLFLAAFTGALSAPPIEWRANIQAGQTIDLANGFYTCRSNDDAGATSLVIAVAAANHQRDRVIRQAGCTQHWAAGANPGWHIDRKVGDSCGLKILRHDGAIINGADIKTYFDCGSEAHGYLVSRGGQRRFVITSETGDDDE